MVDQQGPIPALHCSFSEESETTAVLGVITLPPHLPFHRAPGVRGHFLPRNEGWEGRDEVSLEQQLKIIQHDKDTGPGCVFFSHPALVAPSRVPHASPQWKPGPLSWPHALREYTATEGTHRRPVSGVWPTDVMCLALAVFFKKRSELPICRPWVISHKILDFWLCFKNIWGSGQHRSAFPVTTIGWG